MIYEIVFTSAYKRDIKKIKKRGLNINLLNEIIFKLANGEKLSEKNYDHFLKNNYDGKRECHIQPDWLLIYEIDGHFLYLNRTGTHSDLFGWN